MGAGMRRDLHNGYAARAEGPGRSLAHLHIDAGNALAVLRRPDHLGAELLLQRQVAAGVIEMVMGVQDVGQRPAAARQRLAHRLGLGRIDDSRQPRIRIMDQIGVIVLQAGNEFDLQRGHIVVLLREYGP